MLLQARGGLGVLLHVSLGGLLDSRTQIGVDAGEHAVGLLTDPFVGVAQVDGNVVDEVLLLARLAAEDVPQSVGLDKVLVCDGDLLGNGSACPLLVLLAGLDGLELQRAEARWVVGVRAIVTVDGHQAITLVRVEGPQGAVYGDLLVVDAQAVTVGVGVREEAGLQNWVGRGLDTRDHVRRGEGSLLDLGEVVLRVLVQGEAAEAAQGHLALRPDLGQVKDVPAELLGLLGAQDLDVTGPRWVFAPFNGIKQVLRVPVRVVACQFTGLLIGHGLVALVGLTVDLDVVESAVRLDPLVGVAGVAIHVAVRVRSATVAEEMHDLVSGLLVGG